VAHLFAREGARLIVNDAGVDTDGSGADPSVSSAVAAELTALGAECFPDSHDVSRPDGAADVISLAVERFGRIDVVVNAAGIARDRALLHTDLASFQATLDTNLRGTLLVIQAAAAQMVRQKSGRIVNTVGIGGFLGMDGQTCTAAASAGVYAMTRTASVELQRHGISVNAVAPLAKTRTTDGIPMFEKVGDALSPEHVAPAYLFFASDLCGTRTGLVLSACGGKLSVYRFAESPGRLKEAEDGVWTASEIAAHWDSIARS
jgi:NAD(P)-dependent dehydrogenase (short-subunit alcohol dehydrogenase family)